jgi:hypothetical protein
VDIKKVKDALMDARPNIENYKEVEENVLNLAKKYKSEKEFLDKLDDAIDNSKEIFLKTDLRIFRISIEKLI